LTCISFNCFIEVQQTRVMSLCRPTNKGSLQGGEHNPILPSGRSILLQKVFQIISFLLRNDPATIIPIGRASLRGGTEGT